jgi:hypothetical protein
MNISYQWRRFATIQTAEKKWEVKVEGMTEPTNGPIGVLFYRVQRLVETNWDTVALREKQGLSSTASTRTTEPLDPILSIQDKRRRTSFENSDRKQAAYS